MRYACLNATFAHACMLRIPINTCMSQPQGMNAPTPMIHACLDVMRACVRMLQCTTRACIRCACIHLQEVHVHSLQCIEVRHASRVCFTCTLQWSSDMYKELDRRQEHCTLVVGHGNTEIRIERPTGISPSKQPMVLHKILKALSDIWDDEPTSGVMTVTLQAWTITRALTSELLHLPFFERPATLAFPDCDWQPMASGLQVIPMFVPSCYDRWELFSGAAHCLAGLCEGAAHRSVGSERLCLHVCYNARAISDEQRSQVEACIDEKGLRGQVEVEWDARA